MRYYISLVLLCLGLGSTAQAVTINPGEVWRGDISYGPENLMPASCCPVVPGSESFNSLQQYYLETGPMVVGTTFTAKLFNPDNSLLASVTWGPTSSFHIGGIGLGLGLLGPGPTTRPADGTFELTVSGAPITFNLLEVAAVYDATVTHPTLGPLDTNLLSRNPVTDFMLVVEDPVDPVDPVDPGMPAVPLPATGWLLLAALGGLWGRNRLTRA
ncbi:MAG: hypothetical protein AAF700_13885 [Pseudomonadota bacterium]